MPRRTQKHTETSATGRPATTPESREKQLVALATNLAERQLREGTASSQVITHYLKLGSTKEKLEQEIMEKQKDLIVAKTEAYNSVEKDKELYERVLRAMKKYDGENVDDVRD